jgi:hypothetical protein
MQLLSVYLMPIALAFIIPTGAVNAFNAPMVRTEPRLSNDFAHSLYLIV